MVFDYDIIIIGAGPAGISAAGTLKKQGLKVALLEKTSQIGGTYYASMTNLLKPGPDSLLFSEIKNDVQNMQGFELIDPTTLNDRYFGYIEGPDIDLILENNVYGAKVIMGTVFSVEVSGPEGKRSLSAKAFIDASGGTFMRTIKPRKPETTKKSITVLAGGMGLHDDIKQRINALVEHINENLDTISVEMSPTINKGLYHIRITGDGDEARRALPEIMKQIEGFDGGSKEAFLIHGAGELYSEDIYTQDAKYVVQQYDLSTGKMFEDAIIECEASGDRFYIPYRSLLPVGINNLILCGRSIGARRELSGAMDTLKIAYATGQAAALAALRCIGNNVPLEQADIETISNPFESFTHDYMPEEDADIYIENIDVEDLVELAPEEDEMDRDIRTVEIDESEEDEMDRDIRTVEIDESEEDETIPETGSSEYDSAEYNTENFSFNEMSGGQAEYVEENQGLKEDLDEMIKEPVIEELSGGDGQETDEPFFTKEKIISAIDNPLYDLIAGQADENTEEAEHEMPVDETVQELDKLDFSEEKIIDALNNPLYDLITGEVEESISGAEYEKSVVETGHDAEQSKEEIAVEEPGSTITGFYGTLGQKMPYEADFYDPDEHMDSDGDALAKSIEAAVGQQAQQSEDSAQQEEEVLDFPEEDIIDKLPSYVLFDSQNNALDFSKVKTQDGDMPQKDGGTDKVDELLSLLDVLPDQLPEGLYDFLKENSKSRKRDDELE